MERKVLDNEKGSVMILVTISLLVMIGFAGLAIDGGSVYLTKSSLQNAADAAALAGAKDLPSATLATNKAIEYAQKNGMKATVNGVKELGDTVDIDPHYAPDKIEVVCSREVSTPLLSVLGFGPSIVGSRAVAQRGGVDLEPFEYTLFSGDEIVDVTGNNSIIVGDVYAYEQIGNKHTTIVGDAVVAGNQAKNIDVKDANNKIYDTVEIIPDLFPVVQTQTFHCTNMTEFWDQVDGEEDADGNMQGFLDHEIVYYEGDLDLDLCLFEGVGIIFATGMISMDGGGQESKDDSIIFYSNSSASQGAIHFTGSGQNCMGFLYTPNGETKFSGTGANVIGRIISGPQIKFAGGGATIDGTVLNEDVFEMLKMSLRLVE